MPSKTPILITVECQIGDWPGAVEAFHEAFMRATYFRSLTGGYATESTENIAGDEYGAEGSESLRGPLRPTDGKTK